MERVVGQYLKEIGENGSPEDTTVRVYASILGRIEDHLGHPLEIATKEELRAWRSTIADLSTNTQHSYIGAARSFFKWATEIADVREDNPARVLRAPKQIKNARPRAVDPKFIAEGMLYATEATQWDVRLAIGLGYFGGVRHCEICRLRHTSIKTWPDEVLCLDGKGGKYREIPLTDALMTEIELYGVSRTGYLMKRRDHADGPVRSNRLTQLVSQLYRDMGYRITGHQHRHTFATLTNRAPDADIRVVQELLGHASLTTTQRYVAPNMPKARAMMDSLPSLDLPRQRTTSHRFQVISGGRA